MSAIETSKRPNVGCSLLKLRPPAYWSRYKSRKRRIDKILKPVLRCWILIKLELKWTSNVICLPRSPPRPSPGSVNYTSDDERKSSPDYSSSLSDKASDVSTARSHVSHLSFEKMHCIDGISSPMIQNLPFMFACVHRRPTVMRNSQRVRRHQSSRITMSMAM